jgi:hypothetical protein
LNLRRGREAERERRRDERPPYGTTGTTGSREIVVVGP